MDGPERIGKVKGTVVVIVLFMLATVISIFPGGCSTDQALQKNGQKITKEVGDQLAAYYKSWESSGYLDHKHALKEIGCVVCHAAPIPKEGLSKEQCLECHGSYEEVAKKAPIHVMAIHSHFSDQEVECNSCHKAHKKSVLICNECHHFDIKVP